MQQSVDRILTSHTGSLPRPEDLVPRVWARERGEEVDLDTLSRDITAAVAEIVRKQVAAGITVVSDGEQGKAFYGSYITTRATGFGGTGRVYGGADTLDFPEWNARRATAPAASAQKRLACIGPVAYTNLDELNKELSDFRAAVDASRAAGNGPVDAFLSAASPGVISLFLENQFYPSHEAYVQAVAEAMKVEFDAIYKAGFILQVDCPDLAMGRHSQYASATQEEFLQKAAANVDALNQATRDIPPEAMRMHLCWGNYEGPHHRDIPFADILDLVLSARPAGISFEGANPRHEHEWAIWQDRKLPDGKILIPGVIDSTTNFIEHPELVSQRIQRYANLVGKENVIAGSDCGFGTGAGSNTVDPRITWAKLAAMAEGAELATKALW